MKVLLLLPLLFSTTFSLVIPRSVDAMTPVSVADPEELKAYIEETVRKETTVNPQQDQSVDIDALVEKREETQVPEEVKEYLDAKADQINSVVVGSGY